MKTQHGGNLSPFGTQIENILQMVIVYSIITLTLETLPDLSLSQRRFFEISEVVCVSIFSVEYLTRLFKSSDKLKFVFSFMGVIDLISILPFYLNLGSGSRALRIIRLFRIFRLLKLARYNKAISRFHQAFISVKEELVLFFLASFFLIYLVSVGIYYFENEAQPQAFQSIIHSFWWSVVTLTTVGYGDVYPVTIGGKIFTFFVLMIGVGIITIPAGLIATAMMKTREAEKSETDV
jgi:voltage-gated potassium channel